MIEVLPNGARIVTVSMDVPVVSIGIFFQVGSNYETDPRLNGISHFLEHMAFKGTSTRDVDTIAYEMERYGIDVNAATGHGVTYYYATGLPQHAETMIDVLADIVRDSIFPENELERERAVVIQEIMSGEDDINECVSDLFDSIAYPGQPAGRPIAGTIDSVSSITRDDLVNWVTTHYVGSNMIIVATGSIDESEFIKNVTARLGVIPQGMNTSAPAKQVFSGFALETKQFQQAGICIGFPGVCAYDPSLRGADLLGQVFGGGMSSPLFKEVRERRGLAYSIWAAHVADHQDGMFYIGGETGHTQVKELTEVTGGEISKLVHHVTEQDLIRAKNQKKMAFVRSRMAPSGMMVNSAMDILTYGDLTTMDEYFADIDSWTTTRLQDLARDIFSQPPIMSVIGIQHDRIYESFKGKLSFTTPIPWRQKLD